MEFVPTTRSVSLTDASQRLLDRLALGFDEIHADVIALREMRGKPAGVVRISAAKHVTDTVLWPKPAEFLLDYPDI